MTPLLLLWVVWVVSASGFSWRTEIAAKKEDIRPPLETNLTPLDSAYLGHRRPNVYAIALSELQDLESEPLCHRVAARLLINSCQLLDGKDEATVLTDSGRQVRDFVDAFAASMAICDLERGSFDIPPTCDKFCEAELAQLPTDNDPRLHVSSGEIDECLSGLADSNAAWSTWISYRHKALRFCEAARADQDKSQNILLYKRLTRAIAKLADGVEIELQRRMDALGLRAQSISESLESLVPRVSLFGESISKFERHLSGDLYQVLRRTAKTSHVGLENAANLQQLLKVMIDSILEGNSKVASAHEQSLEVVSRGNGAMNALTSEVTTAVSTLVSLSNQIELARIETLELATRQHLLEQGFDHLLAASSELSSQHDDHTQQLNQARNLTDDILGTLEDAAASATSINGSFFKDTIVSSWWPYLICPAATLFLGSYGLAPSAFRNLGLLALGEVIGLAVSSLDRFSTAFLGSLGTEYTTNATISAL